MCDFVIFWPEQQPDQVRWVSSVEDGCGFQKQNWLNPGLDQQQTQQTIGNDMSSYVPKKVDLKPKKHHGYAALLFILGTLLPPLGQSHRLLYFESNASAKAVAARFGIGRDFWINVFLTLCGYIPG